MASELDNVIKVERFIELKTKVKNECLRRKYVGPVDEYGGSDWDFSPTPEADNIIDEDYYRKISIPLRKINWQNAPNGPFEREINDADLLTFEANVTAFMGREITDNVTPTDCSYSCTGTCTTSCTGGCGNGCTGTCTGCSGSCTGGCKGTCKQYCGDSCAGGYCRLNCESGCGNGCAGQCTSSCWEEGAACSSCSGCSNECVGDCSKGCGYECSSNGAACGNECKVYG